METVALFFCTVTGGGVDLLDQGHAHVGPQMVKG